MKTVKILIATFILCGCSSEKPEIPSQQQEDSDINPAAVIAQINSPATRTALDIESNVVWTSGDEILIWNTSSPSGEVYSTTSHNVRTGIFLPLGEPVSGTPRYALYPASAASGEESTNSTIEINLQQLASQAPVGSLTPDTHIAALPMIAASNNESFTFRNICGGIQLQFNDYQSVGITVKSIVVTSQKQITGKASVDAGTGAVTLTEGDGQNTITIDCGEGITISSEGNSQFLLFLPAGTYADGLHFRLTDIHDRCYEVATAQAITVTAGIVTPLQTLPFTLYYGDVNCYRTTGAGEVQINVTPYYTFSANYVHENLIRSNIEGQTAGLPQSAKIVWQQVNSNSSGDVVTSLALNNNNTELSVTTTGNPGNALVAICDGNDEILWSYHVWVSEANDITFTNTPRGTYTLMDRNLGATSTTLKDRNAYGLFYQWGRKDPFARNLTAARPTGSPHKSPSSDLQESTTATAQTGTIIYANRNPQTRLLSTSDWYVGGNDKLWGFVDENSGVKTIYDPCPSGYRVADYNCFAKFSKDVNCTAQYGYLIKSDSEVSSYYPTAGYLPQNENVMQYLEYRGYIWNNQPGNGPTTAASTTPNRFYYNADGVTINKSEYRAAGMAVRCVKME